MALSLRDLRELIEERLPAYMMPSTFVPLPALPLTPNGKVDRRALPAPDLSALRSEAEHVGPRTPVEQALAAVWEQVLGVPRPSVQDNFFELGGDSITSVQVVARLRRQGIDLMPRQLFEFPTIAQLATLVGGGSVPPSTEEGRGNIPLLPAQRRLLEQTRESWAPPQRLLPRTPLQPALLAAALGAVARHHEALDLRFEREGGSWRQERRGAGGRWPLVLIDLRSLEDEAAGRAAEILERELRAGLDPERGPLARAALLRLAGGSDRLSLLAHEIAVDASSWAILLEDLESAYAQLARDEPIRLPAVPTSFGRWAESLSRYALSPEIQQDAAFWMGRQRNGVLLAGDPGDAEMEIETVSASLGRELSRSLALEAPSAYRAEPDDLLLAALAKTFQLWTGQSRLHVDLQASGRADIAGVDSARTVGCLVTRFPIWLDIGAATEPGDLIKGVKEQLRAVPKRGIPYGWLRPRGAEGSRSLEQGLADVAVELPLWSNVETSGALFAVAPQSPAPRRRLRAAGGPMISLTCSFEDGELQTVWTYEAGRHGRGTIESLVHSYLVNLQRLVEHCLSPQAGGFTPSDFGKLDLGQEELDELLAQIQERLE
jgi:microcystin synthetase protein McyA